MERGAPRREGLAVENPYWGEREDYANSERVFASRRLERLEAGSLINSALYAMSATSGVGCSSNHNLTNIKTASKTPRNTFPGPD